MPTKTEAQQNGNAAEDVKNDLLMPATSAAKTVARVVHSIRDNYLYYETIRIGQGDNLTDPIPGMAPDPKGAWEEPESKRRFTTYRQLQERAITGLAAIKEKNADNWAQIEEEADMLARQPRQ